MSDYCYDEQIVMTPTKRGHGHTTIIMERLKSSDMDHSKIRHVAGGDHKGIVIQDCVSGKNDNPPPELLLGFKAILKSMSNNKVSQENWQLKFWFKPSVAESDRVENAQAFLKELVAPKEFPKDYVGFIKKTMKLMQLRYPNIQKVEVEMREMREVPNVLEKPVVTREIPAPMNGSTEDIKLSYNEEKVLEVVETVYPNSVSVSSVAKSALMPEDDVQRLLFTLQSKGFVKRMDNGNYMRITDNDKEVKIVKQIPMVIGSKQPTIAIITAQFCEKLAVDAMMENKETYVKYKTEGKCLVCIFYIRFFAQLLNNRFH